MSLDPLNLSPAELIALAEKRQRERVGARAQPREVFGLGDGSAAAEDLIGVRGTDPEPIGVIQIGNPPIAIRHGARLTLTLLFAPRTKKNSSTLGVRQSDGYRRFRNAVVRHLASFKAELGLPLPDLRYTLTARFFTDNDSADLLGLLQGLADALENAGVVANDRVFHSFDGSGQQLDKLRPRVELTITPILGEHLVPARPWIQIAEAEEAKCQNL